VGAFYLKQVPFHHLMLFREADGGPGGIMRGFTFGDRILRGIIELGGDFLCKVEELGQKTLRDWYLSHLEKNDDGSGLISTIAIRDAALNGLGVHLLISFMTRKLGFLLWQATSSMTE